MSRPAPPAVSHSPALIGRALAGMLYGVSALDLVTLSGVLLLILTAAVLSSLYPVTTVILAVVILRERVTRSHVVGIALTAVAIVLIGLGTATL